MDLEKLMMSYLKNSKDDISLYKGWIMMYIIGDRRKADIILKRLKPVLFQISKYLNHSFPTEKQTLYRGVLLPPDFDINDYKMWDYDHVSFTEDKEIAKAFSDINSKLGFMFSKDSIGHILEYVQCNEDHVWFHYKWAEEFEPEFYEFITSWGQKEVLLGKI